MEAEKRIGRIKSWLMIMNLIIREEITRLAQCEFLPMEDLKTHLGEKVFEIVEGDPEKVRKVISQSAKNLSDFVNLLETAETALKNADYQKVIVTINLITAKLNEQFSGADTVLYEELNEARSILENSIPCA